MIKRKSTLGVFQVLVAGILWGCIGIFIRTLSACGFSSMELVAVRTILTMIMLVTGIYITNKHLLKIHWKDIWCFFGTGIMSIVFFNFCYFKAMQITSLSIAAVMLYTAPAMVMIMSLFLFKEKLNTRKMVSLVLAFVGCVCVTGVLSSKIVISLEALLAGMGAAFGYALYTIFGRYAIERKYHTLTITAYTFIVASIGLLPLVRWKHVVNVAFSNLSVFGICLLFAIVSTVLPYLFYTQGLTHLESGKASVMASIEPVVATIIGCVVFNEKLSFWGILGIVLVFLSLVVLNINSVQKRGCNKNLIKNQ